MKKLGLILVMAMMAVMFAAGGAWAVPVYTGDTAASFTTTYDGVIIPFDAIQTDHAPGYYIWSNDSRTEWSVRWTGEGTVEPIWTFYGNVEYSGNDIISWNSDLLESTGYWIDKVWALTPVQIYLDAYANTGWDGFDFILPSGEAEIGNSLTFCLQANPMSLPAEDWGVFMGQDFTPVELGECGCFEVAAPVPEPGTMALLGIGLLGLAFIGRRKLKIEE